jgi:homoserine kinase
MPSKSSAPKASSVVVVEVEVNHGDYQAAFHGSGPTILAAAEDAARKSSYSIGLFDAADSFYAPRAKYRDELSAALAQGAIYRGFGWCNFRLVA